MTPLYIYINRRVFERLSGLHFRRPQSSVIARQVAIQGDELRITGKKRDDLQEVIAFLKEKGGEQPLQFENFRD